MHEFYENFHFLRPAALLLLPLALGLWIWWQRQADPLRGWREQIAPELLKELTVGGEAGFLRSGKHILAGWTIASVAIAGPTWRLEPSPFADDATPLLILLKADISMDTPDPAPSRRERASLKIADLAAARKGQPLGLIAYAGSAHLVMPATRDTDAVVQMANEISPEIMPIPGDRLDLALQRAHALLNSTDQGGSIVVLADSINKEHLIALTEESLQPATTAPGNVGFSLGKYPITILSINANGSSQETSIRTAAKLLDANVEQIDVDDKDINAIVRFASRAPKATSEGDSSRWQESGYWLTPLVAVFMLLSFWRKEPLATS